MGIIQTLGMWKERIIRMFKGNIKNEFGVTGITSNAMEDAITDWMDVYQGKASWVDHESRQLNLQKLCAQRQPD